MSFKVLNKLQFLLRSIQNFSIHTNSNKKVRWFKVKLARKDKLESCELFLILTLSVMHIYAKWYVSFSMQLGVRGNTPKQGSYLSKGIANLKSFYGISEMLNQKGKSQIINFIVSVLTYSFFTSLVIPRCSTLYMVKSLAHL